MTATDTANKTKENVGSALSRIPSGVYVVTVGSGKERDGMLATWINQAAFEPPMVTVAVKKERPILAKLQVGAQFVVNVLGKKNMDIFKNFAKPHSEDLDRFAGLNVVDTSAGPQFSDAISYMNCKVVTLADAGDHVVVVAQVDDGALLRADDEPMVHLRKNGFQY